MNFEEDKVMEIFQYLDSIKQSGLEDWCIYSSDFTQKYMFIMQNTGTAKQVKENTKKHYLAEMYKQIQYQETYLKSLRENEDFNNLKKWVEACQKDFSIWMYYLNRTFHPFYEILKSKGLIGYSKLFDYLKSGVFKDFYITDLVKYRKSTNEINNIDRKNGMELLDKEIRWVNPDPMTNSWLLSMFILTIATLSSFSNLGTTFDSRTFPIY